MTNHLSTRDAQVIWHPYTQMQTATPAIPIVRGEGALLFDVDGKAYIDGISSWWVNIHGHAHPYIAEKIARQALTLEHCIFAGFTHEPAVAMAERLLPLLPSNQAKLFYSDDGSTAVEVAIKMALQYWGNQGVHKQKILALKNAYHGDTFGAMSVSGRSIFTAPFADLLFEVEFIDITRVDENFQLPASMLHGVAAFIYEPLIQGSGGMIMYDKTALEHLLHLLRAEGVLLIADEVMTGFGRTGKNFATEYLTIVPDIMCFSKGLTGGVLPLGVTTCTRTIYEAFLSNDKLKTFFHGHSYTANPLACTAALASLELLLKTECRQNIERIQLQHRTFAAKIRSLPIFKNVRTLGTIIAFEVATAHADAYTNTIRDFLYHFFLEKGILLRPLGNTLYIMPPYCISTEQLEVIYQAIMELHDVLQKMPLLANN